MGGWSFGKSTNHLLVLTSRERLNIKKRQEAWQRLEEEAKRNPGFDEYALPLKSVLPYVPTESFTMIDEEAVDAAGGEELLQELAAGLNAGAGPVPTSTTTTTTPRSSLTSTAGLNSKVSTSARPIASPT